MCLLPLDRLALEGLDLVTAVLDLVMRAVILLCSSRPYSHVCLPQPVFALEGLDLVVAVLDLVLEGGDPLVFVHGLGVPRLTARSLGDAVLVLGLG